MSRSESDQVRLLEPARRERGGVEVALFRDPDAAAQRDCRRHVVRAAQTQLASLGLVSMPDPAAWATAATGPRTQ